MIAIGCFLPLVLLILGGIIGVAIGTTTAGLWGAGAGFVIGCIALIAMLWGFDRLKGREE
ncbi:MAG: hypothetical protein WB902_00190 [Acetobacteraceae bacterium]|jgi:hypothetical protein